MHHIQEIAFENIVRNMSFCLSRPNDYYWFNLFKFSDAYIVVTGMVGRLII